MDEELKLLMMLDIQTMGEQLLEQAAMGLEHIATSAEHLSGTRAALAEVGANIAKIGAGMMGVGAGVAAGMGELVKAAADWQTTVTQIANNTNQSDQAMQTMSATVLKMGQTTSAPLDDLAEGYKHITNFGFNAKDATVVLNAAMESAVSTGGKTADVANTLAAVMHEFNLPASEAAKTMDELHTAAALGNMDLGDLVQPFGQVSAAASALGIPLDQVAAGFAAMTRHGFDANEAGTQIKDLLQHLVNPSKGAQAEIAKLAQTTGVDLTQDFSQAGLASKGLTGVLADIAKATHGNVDAFAALTGQAAPTAAQLQQIEAASHGDMTALAKMVPNIRGLYAEFLLTGNGAKDYADILRQVDAATQGAGITATSYARTQGTLSYQVGVLKNNLQAAAIQLGTAMLPAVQQLAAAVLPLVQRFADWAAQHATLIARAAELAAAVGLIGGAALMAAGMIAVIVAAMNPLSLAVAAIVVGVGALGAAWATNFGGIRTDVAQLAPTVGKLFATVQQQALPAFQQFAATLGAQVGPALQTLGGIVTSDLLPAVEGVGTFVVETLAPALAKLAGVVLSTVLPILGQLAGWFAANLLPALSQAGTAVLTFTDQVLPRITAVLQNLIIPGVTQLMTDLAALWDQDWTGIETFLSGIWQAIEGVIKLTWDVITGIIRIALDLLAGNWQQAWADLKQMLQDAWNDFQQIIGGGFKAMLGLMQTFFDTVLALIKGFAPDFANAGEALIEGLKQGIMAKAQDILQAITGIVQGAINAAKSLLHISSPSQVFAQIGQQMAAGLVQGLKGSAANVQVAVGAVTGAAVQGAVTTPAGQSAAAGVQITITGNYLLADRDLTSLATQVGRVLVQQTGLATSIRRR